MSDILYDLLILGAGPAGITAAVYAARKNLSFKVITQDIGGQAALSGDIENYTGYQFISGPELALKFQEHMTSFNISISMPEKAQHIDRKNAIIITTTNTTQYHSRSLIIATGKSPRLLNISGEKEFKNKGVTYCATCDGPLYKNKTVAVIGGGNSALDAVMQLMTLCTKVYLINISQKLTGDSIMVKKITQSSNVEIFNNTQITKIIGNEFVTDIEINTENRLQTIPLQGVFVEIGLNPNSSFAKNLTLNEDQEIIVDTHNSTNISGIFAAGDVTSVPEKQIIIACGEGSKACLSAFKFISLLPH